MGNNRLRRAVTVADFPLIAKNIEQMRPPHMMLAGEAGTPVSGDGIRRQIYDPHPTHPFRMGDLLWPMLAESNR